VSETPNETGDRIAAVPASPTGPPAAAAQVSFPAADKKSGLSNFLEWSKPYREVIAVLVTLIVSISGAVAWVVAHFATRAEMHYLECRVTNNILTQLLPIHMEEFAGKIDWRSAQIKALAQHGGGTPQSIGTIVDLTDQVNTLTKEQGVAAKKFQQDIDEIVKNCASESPQAGKVP
jgi:hypothetical protein